MARRVYFAFHYQRDIFRVNQVRNSNKTKANREEIGFYDGSLWEEAKKKGEADLKRLINSGLDSTSVTCVLIGCETCLRPWVRYEIVKSYARGNGMLGVRIHQQVCTKSKQADSRGANPFEFIGIKVSNDGKKIFFSEWNGMAWVSFAKLSEMSTNCSQEHWGKFYQLSTFYSLYDWKDDDGYNNFGDWVEAAAKAAGN